VPGIWSGQIDAAMAKPHEDLTCPNCGFSMAHGVSDE